MEPLAARTGAALVIHYARPMSQATRVPLLRVADNTAKWQRGTLVLTVGLRVTTWRRSLPHNWPTGVSELQSITNAVRAY
jgi:hypothetical protein